MNQPITRFITTIRKTGAGKDKDKKLSIILLNSTPGYRMKSIGPKCLLKISDNVSILDSQIEVLKKCYPNSEIIITLGFEADKIIKKNSSKGVRYVENQLYETTNLVEELRLALNNCETSDVLIVYGDLIFNTTAVDNITKDGSCMVCAEKNNFEGDEVGVTIVDGMITILSYGINPKWSHIMYLTGNELSSFKNLCNDREKSRMYPFELVNILLSKNSNKIKAVQPINAEIIKVESVKDLIKNENSNS